MLMTHDDHDEDNVNRGNKNDDYNHNLSLCKMR